MGMGYTTSLVERFGWSSASVVEITQWPLPVLRNFPPHKELSPRTKSHARFSIGYGGLGPGYACFGSGQR